MDPAHRQALEEHRQRIESSEPGHVVDALDSLKRRGYLPAQETIVLIESCLDHEEAEVRAAALKALRRDGSTKDRLLSASRTALMDSDKFVRVEAIRLVAKWHLATEDAMELLQAGLSDEDDFVRARTLGFLPATIDAAGMEVDAATALARKFEKDPSRDVRNEVEDVLLRLKTLDE